MKKCKCGCERDVFSHGYSKYCQYKRRDKKWLDSLKKNKQRKAINPISSKQKERLKEYSIVRDEYLNDHSVCEICGSERNLVLHHKKGRIGTLLTDKRYFMTLCYNCHEIVHSEDAWARENGYLLTRIN